MPPSRTVAPYSPTRTPPASRRSRVTAGIRRLSYGIPTRSKRCTDKSAKRSKPEDTSQPRRPPVSSSTSPSTTRSAAGDRPTTGAQHYSRSKSTSETDYPDPLTQEVGHPPAPCGNADWCQFPPAAASIRACGSPAHGSPTFFAVGIRLAPPSPLRGRPWPPGRAPVAVLGLGLAWWWS
jgi:hypothetical protein